MIASRFLIIPFLLVLSLPKSVSAQTKLPFLNTLATRNLKGPVKSVKFYYTQVTKINMQYPGDTMSYKMLNDVKQSYFTEFDRIGNKTFEVIYNVGYRLTPIDTSKARKYQYFEEDFTEKSKNMSEDFKFLFFHFPFIQLDVFTTDNRTSQKGISLFTNKLSDNRIVEQSDFLSHHTEYQKAKTDNFLYARKELYYDNNGRISGYKIIGGEDVRSSNMMGTSVPLCPDNRMEFAYDTKNRITKATFTACGKEIVREEYTYSATGSIIKMKRVITKGLTSDPYDVRITTYNEQGDVVEVDFPVELPGKTASHREREKKYRKEFFRKTEYEYDRFGNWIKARVYLKSFFDEPTLTAERIIEYYDEPKK